MPLFNFFGVAYMENTSNLAKLAYQKPEIELLNAGDVTYAESGTSSDGIIDEAS